MVTAARVDTKILMLTYRTRTNSISPLVLFQLAEILLLIKYQFTEVLSSLDDRCGEKAQKKKQYSTMWHCMRTGRTVPQVRLFQVLHWFLTHLKNKQTQKQTKNHLPYSVNFPRIWIWEEKTLLVHSLTIQFRYLEWNSPLFEMTTCTFKIFYVILQKIREAFLMDWKHLVERWERHLKKKLQISFHSQEKIWDFKNLLKLKFFPLHSLWKNTQLFLFFVLNLSFLVNFPYINWIF